jgi:thioredoxin reductase
MEHHEVVIIGGGPAGLALAHELHKLGLKGVVVLEREQEAGGIPRHCGHLGFGIDNKSRFLTGPNFASQLRELTKDLDIRIGATVLEFTLHGTMRLHSSSGISEMSATRIVLATGTRESSRAARLIGGNRLPGVMNTGTFQQLVYLKHQKPFSNPVIIGSEWVSFSNLLTCKHAKIKPVCMITENTNLDAPSYFGIGAKLAFGVSVKRCTKLLSINGHEKVESVEVESGGRKQTIACDGVIISGRFRSENALYSSGYIEHENTAPKTTDMFRTSKPNIYAVGNVLGHLETAGACMLQGRKLAALIASDLK